MNTWKVIFATMVIFGTGVVTGGLLVKYSERIHVPRPRMANQGRPPVPIPAGIYRVEVLRRAERELELDPEQKAKVDHILSASQERTRKLLEPISPKIREELQRTRDEFVAVLTQEQRTQFDEIIKQQQQRSREQKRNAPRPPDKSTSLPSPNGEPVSKP